MQLMTRRRFAALAACGGVAGGFVIHASMAQHAAPLPDSLAPSAVPAEVASAERQDVPIYVTGIGAVQAGILPG